LPSDSIPVKVGNTIFGVNQVATVESLADVLAGC
jgi:hypothetical protein